MPRMRAPETLVEEMPLRKLVGQALAVYPECYSEKLASLLEDTQAGSIIFVPKGIKSGQEARRITEALQRVPAMNQHGLPLLVCSEHDGGFGALPPKATPFPSSMAIAASRSAKRCYDVAFALALELRSIGVNVNLAPVAGLNHGSENPFGIRSFGDDSSLAAKLAGAYVRGLQHGGVSAAATPFPVRPGAESKGKLVITHPLERLLSLELKPFSECVRVGADAALMGMATVQAIDPSEAAAMSSRVVTGLLRGRLGFRGLAIADLRGEEAARLDASKAMEAGNDLLIIEESAAPNASEEILAEARKSRVFARRVREAALRVLGLKSKRLSRFRRPSLAAYGASLHLRLAQKVAAESVAVAKNGGNIPLKKDGTVLVICPKLGEGAETGSSALSEAIRNFGRQVRDFPVGVHPTKEEARRASEEAGSSENVVLGSLDGHANKELADLVRQCLEANPSAILVSLGNPYELKLYGAQNCIATFGFSKPSLDAAAAIMLGKSKPLGTMPVKLS
ncbi:MAG: hypothetical protein JTT11_07710 [Candidatus Brockarchaeota archaeon]|nr:hypothetical protein [Candidatus Brockarchaeota archaeon]